VNVLIELDVRVERKKKECIMHNSMGRRKSSCENTVI
jgi:hypothetical protein